MENTHDFNIVTSVFDCLVSIVVCTSCPVDSNLKFSLEDMAYRHFRP